MGHQDMMENLILGFKYENINSNEQQPFCDWLQMEVKAHKQNNKTK